MSKLPRVSIVFGLGLGFLLLAMPLILLYELAVFFTQWYDQLIKAYYNDN
jgi:Sec-independent protein secretion pathway component TatC